MTDNRWAEAHERIQARVVAHPDFAKLVREVAVAEQVTGAPRRLRLNSVTYGHWVTRGMKWPRKGGKADRARYFATKIAKDCKVYPDLPAREGEALVYVCARDYVRAREAGR